ncbi:hypothetical protein Tco_1130288, partial [Tanacetum coccineum]
SDEASEWKSDDASDDESQKNLELNPLEKNNLMKNDRQNISQARIITRRRGMTGDLWEEEVISVKGIPWVGDGGVSGVSLSVVSLVDDKNGKVAGNCGIWSDDGSSDGSDPVSNTACKEFAPLDNSKATIMKH